MICNARLKLRERSHYTLSRSHLLKLTCECLKHLALWARRNFTTAVGAVCVETAKAVVRSEATIVAVHIERVSAAVVVAIRSSSGRRSSGRSRSNSRRTTDPRQVFTIHLSVPVATSQVLFKSRERNPQGAIVVVNVVGARCVSSVKLTDDLLVRVEQRRTRRATFRRAIIRGVRCSADFPRLDPPVRATVRI